MLVTVNVYLCRCLEVNTRPQVTKPDYLFWTLSRNFSTYRPEKKILYIISSLKIWRENFLLNDIFE